MYVTPFSSLGSVSSSCVGFFRFLLLFGNPADPDIIDRKIQPEDEFIVLACDGIWDVLTNQEVVSFVRSMIAKGHELDAICEMVGPLRSLPLSLSLFPPRWSHS